MNDKANKRGAKHKQSLRKNVTRKDSC